MSIEVLILKNYFNIPQRMIIFQMWTSQSHSPVTCVSVRAVMISDFRHMITVARRIQDNNITVSIEFFMLLVKFIFDFINVF